MVGALSWLAVQVRALARRVLGFRHVDMAAGYRIPLDDGVPTIDEIARRFRDATGLELSVEQYNTNSYAISSAVLRRDAELILKPVVELVFFRIGRGYFEWAILRAVQRLGGRIPEDVFPQYSDAPWSSLKWYSRWLHR